MGKTIIISNRLPVRIADSEGILTFQPSEGGLATGLGSIYKSAGNIWLGWPGIYLENEQQKKEVDKKLLELSLYPVYLTNEEINQYYEGFSNEILWPVFHYMSAYASYENSYWEFYHSVNKKFCDAVLRLFKPGDTIWIHDYQLLLLAGMIRKEQPDAVIGFFQHIPFPSFELFRLIPWRTELLEGMLGANLIGFHTYDDSRHFLSACSRLLSIQSSFNTVKFHERNIVVESFPMGIDNKKFASLTNDRVVTEHVTKLKEIFGKTKLILSIDRLDYSKGIIQRLQAFDLLLKNHSEQREKVSLYMIVVPSRDKVKLYKELHDEIDKLAGNINARYRTNTWTPINYFYRSFPVEMLSALYQLADVCLVTPMRDGMNLVCKEFVSSRINNNGVLILSEMAGAAKELIDAIVVNPNNTAEISNAMLTALNMPDAEQQKRMIQMRELVTKYNVHYWVDMFMKRLKEVDETQYEVQSSRYAGFLVSQDIRTKYIKSKKRLILLDYDGTLVDFSDDINAASPDKELYEIIKDLADDEKNTVVIISGRKKNSLNEWFGNMNIDLVAEHGAWQKTAINGWHETMKLDNEWQKGVMPILQVYTDRTPGSFIEEKSTSLAWHYRKAECELGEFRANELKGNLRYLISDLPLQVLPGNKVIEVKSRDINKGKSALHYINTNDYNFILAIGDDHTDEDMFKAVKDVGITIRVGDNKSAASFYFKKSKEARNLLNSLPSKLIITKLFDEMIRILPVPSLGGIDKK